MLQSKTLSTPINFQALFEATPTPCLVLSPDSHFTIVEVNEAYLHATRTTRESIIGQGVFEVFPANPDDSNTSCVINFRASLNRVVANCVTDIMPIYQYDIPCQEVDSKGFETRYWSPINIPVLGERNTLDLIVHRVEDVTEFMLSKPTGAEQCGRIQQLQAEIYQHVKKAEQTQAALRISNERYNLLTSILPVGIFHTNPEGYCIYVNPQWQEITGIDLAHNRDKPWFELVHPEDVHYAREAWRHSQQTFSVFKVEVRFLLPNGKERWVLAQAVPEIREEKIQSYVSAITDITQNKKVEKEHYQGVQEAEVYRKCQEQFIDTMCHELRNPLNGVLGNVALLEDNTMQLQKLIETTEPEQISSPLREKSLEFLGKEKESIQTIKMCAEYQKVITDDVLSLSKLEAGKVELSLVDFDPKKVIKETVAMLNSEISRKNLQLYLKLIYKDIAVNGDPDRLKQILLNLLTNAIKFTPPGGEIAISLKSSMVTESHTVLIFTVKDTGIGMTEEEKSRIFERFSQANTATHQQYGGSGLGLSISRSLIVLMGGNIHVKSEPGKGTKFTFTIQCPLLSLQKAPPPSLSVFAAPSGEILPPIASAIPSANRLILIVEDNLINQKILKHILEQAGHHCEIANNGKESLLVLGATPFDIVFMDIEMPLMSGLEATRIIRRTEQEQGKSPIPIIGLSGYSRQEQREEAKNSGMNDYLTKPYDKAKLLEKIDFYTKAETPVVDSKLGLKIA
ncbi:MAG: multisensor hybrid histidine kinase [Gammaproteobacteria bacterium]|jgi:PAS domain S-box-containing protein|nr:multisensor hybrid histidine kinase [Gammaproteobacteria bacterium]